MFQMNSFQISYFYSLLLLFFCFIPYLFLSSFHDNLFYIQTVQIPISDAIVGV